MTKSKSPRPKILEKYDRLLATKWVVRILSGKSVAAITRHDFNCSGSELCIGCAAADIAKESVRTRKMVTEIALERNVMHAGAGLTILDPYVHDTASEETALGSGGAASKP